MQPFTFRSRLMDKETLKISNVMKTKHLLFIGFLLVMLTSSCRHVNIGGGIKPNKNYITRDFKVNNFNKLDVSLVADVFYTQSKDNTVSFQIYGSENLIELVTTEIKDNTLIIDTKKSRIKNSDLKIHISSPDLRYVKMQGVGNLNIKETLETTELVIKNEGVGNVNIENAVCQKIDIRTEGVGNIKAKGKATHVKLSSMGVGNIKAAELKGDSVVATSDGVGNIACYAEQYIKATANGVGNISFQGNPTDKKLNKNGIGSIKQK